MILSTSFWEIGAGRVPNVEGLNLEGVGVAYDPRKGVEVDDFLRTANPRIYAAGDVCQAHKFTHTADAAARIVIQNALFRGRKRYSALTIPWCTYTDPEIAHVGMYERDARERGIPVDTFVREMKAIFPDRKLEDVPLTHAIFHCVFDLKEKPQVPGIDAGIHAARLEQHHDILGGHVARGAGGVGAAAEARDGAVEGAHARLDARQQDT